MDTHNYRRFVLDVRRYTDEEKSDAEAKPEARHFPIALAVGL